MMLIFMSKDCLRLANIRFFNLWAKIYDKDPISRWLFHLQKKVLRQIPFSSKSRILDVGCATGNVLRILSEAGTKILAGIDISPEMIKRAEKKLGSKAKLIVASVEDIPFPSNYFDFVINTEAFHHFSNPKKAVKEMTRVLKKGGLLYISDVNFYISFIHWLSRKIEPGHNKIYSLNEFRELFEGAGLDVVTQKRIGLFVILSVGEKR